MIKKILIGLVILFALAQFVQPDRTMPAPDPAKDMLAMTNAPAEVRTMFQGACYDCHSYNTVYPWYSRVTPVNFWMQHHINEGREKVNYAEWDRYATNEEAAETGESIQKGEMPPGYYTFMHDHGRLTAAQKQQLIAWSNAVIGVKESGGGHREGGEEHGHGHE